MAFEALSLEAVKAGAPVNCVGGKGGHFWEHLHHRYGMGVRLMGESLGCLEWSPQPLALVSVLYRAVGGEQMSLGVLWGAVDFLCDLSEPNSVN